MSSKRDYYEILGVSKGAEINDIKSAYRKLAMQYHPDRVSADKKHSAEEKFKEISEAYAVLSDSNKRSLYDQYGHSGIDQRYNSEDIFRGADFSSIFSNMGGGSGSGGSIFEELFGDTGFDIFGGGSTRKRSRRGRNIQFEITITLQDAYKGVTKIISVPRYEVCSDCNGSGAKSGTKKMTCPACKGKGKQIISQGFFQLAQTCPRCGGEGVIINTPCPKCAGRGKVKVTRKIEVKIPAGVDTGSHLRIRDEGEIGSSGKGDLFILVNVKQDSILKRDGDYIVCTVDIPLTKAILGGEVEVPTLDGDVKMKIPAGTQSEKVFRLRNKGMPGINSYSKGDELVRVNVVIPNNLTTPQRKLIEELAHLRGEDTAGQKSFKEKIKRAFK
ncbi:MAG: molecular chaperone DnaJ [Candidatus Gygaella obscura]|nr:molecular chaperone DnaJ [Candidatus Gygaella obscura]